MSFLPVDPTSHECPGGCGSRVPGALFTCKPDWFRLPHALRSAISAAWRDGDKSAHGQAMTRALDWYRRNPRQSPVPRRVKPSESRLF